MRARRTQVRTVDTRVRARAFIETLALAYLSDDRRETATSGAAGDLARVSPGLVRSYTKCTMKRARRPLRVVDERDERGN